MKKIYLFLIIILSLLAYSCGKHVEYEIAYQNIVPDSLQTEYRNTVVELTKAGSKDINLTGKSRNYGQIVNQAEQAAFKIFSRQEKVLRVLHYYGVDYSYSDYVFQKDFDSNQKLIFESLLKNQIYEPN